MNKKIILFSILSILFFANPVFAVNSELVVSPATGAKNISDQFNVSINLDPQQNKICVVKGKINFDKLSCQSVTVVDGIFSAMFPTCENPNFILGILGCTTESKNILNISVKATQSGIANVFFTDVNFWGAGATVPFVANSGAYNVSEKIEILPVLESSAEDEIELVEIQEIEIAEEEVVVEENQIITEDSQNSSPMTASLLDSVLKNMAEMKIIIFVIILIALVAGIWQFFKNRKK